ncbi:glycosyltransferase family 4 protein [Panacibacter ginsenosidivorans]|uniref:Glycosyltransferase family 4 protein n=1 Tax=Panacibacter ginsenosidivorans TaxID=1813871 RepID=A0A5B8VAU1_9BACT|nr:glycosyltransferase family 4 protein [Panacibacter ginsenosidivorans]QEC67816.1 glycosyltransferase family 4 protein [Panacibacter ginsenosidivorans]
MELAKDKKFSVVQIIDRLNIGGTERVLVTLSNLLQDNGHHVAVVTTVTKGPLAVMLNKEIPVIELKRKWKWNPVTMYRLIKAVKHFDIIHVHSSYNLRYLFLAVSIFRLKRPIFFHEHFGDINIDQSVRWHTKLIYPKTILIAVSKQIADWAMEKLKMPAYKVFVLPNTVIRGKYPSVQLKKDGIKRLLIVSNFRPTKNILAGIQILENLLSRGSSFHLTIMGQVADKAYYDSIVNYIGIQQLQEAVSIRTKETDIQSVLYEFDLAMHTATSESGPLVLIEYMAQGLPFITYDTGEVVQQIKSDLPECVMQNFDIEEWSNRIQELLQKDNDALQQQLLKLFDTYYSVDAYYEKCLHIYRKGLEMC